MPRREELLLEEMIDAAQHAMALVASHQLSDLLRDRMRRDALLWNFTVLGEGATQLSPDFKSKHPDINWQRPSQLRNRIVHGYWSIDLEILHETARRHLPDFVADLRALKTALSNDAK